MLDDNPSKDSSGLDIEAANELVLEHRGWSESIAKSVARSWNMDWKLDGLDGAALEALIFCARRFNPGLGVPFRGYARKRIHEASTEAARRSRGWTRGAGSKTRTERLAREVSAELFNVFPELRSGILPGAEEEAGSQGTRIAIQQLLIGASVIATRQGLDAAGPDDTLDFKKMVSTMAKLEAVHQLLLWKIYWEGNSLRRLAGEWKTDELNVIREHKVIVEFLHKHFTRGRNIKFPRVRPGLRHVIGNLTEKQEKGVFATFLETGEA